MRCQGLIMPEADFTTFPSHAVRKTGARMLASEKGRARLGETFGRDRRDR